MHQHRAQKTILLVDLLDDGHHQMFMGLVIDYLISLGHNVTCFCSDPSSVSRRAESRGYSQSIGKLKTIYFETKHRRGMRNVRYGRVNRWLSLTWGVIRYKVRPTRILLLYGDSFTLENTPSVLRRCVKLFLDLAFPWKWTALYFHPYRFRSQRLDPTKQQPLYDIVFKARSCKGVGIFDEILLSSVAKDFRRPVVHIPDVHYLPVACCAGASGMSSTIVQQSNGRFIVVLLGILQRRKNLLNLLQAAQLLPRQKFYFAICGSLVRGQYHPCELDRIDMLVGGSENIFFHPYLLSEVDFHGVASVANAFYAAYSGFPHSSNIMTVAAFQQVPVLVGKGFLMQERAVRYKTGVAVDETSVQEIADSISNLPAFDNISAGWDAYLADHSLSTFHARLRQLLSL